MTMVRVAAVQASYVLMDREATLNKVADLTAKASAQHADLVVFPEVFIPGTPIWIDLPIWDGDDEWFRLLAENAVTVPGPATERLGSIARENGVWLVVGVEERERHGGTIYNAILYFSPDGALVERHRKLVPTGSERTVWGMGDGSMLRVVDTPFGRVGGLICWENYMPLARFHLYAQGVDIWLAPTLALGDGWIATMRHLARENRMFVIGVNPVLHVDQIPQGFPKRDRLVQGLFKEEDGGWVDQGNTVIVAPNGEILAGPIRRQEETLIADLDLGQVLSERRKMDPVGHYNRPDVFRLYVDTSPRSAVVEVQSAPNGASQPKDVAPSTPEGTKSL
jgi:nitrilase